MIALSSAESELAGMVRGTCEALGAVAVAKDLGSSVEATLLVDSSAALGIAERSGAGKIRHLDTGMLWIQQKQRRGDIQLEKVPGSNNPADMWTKNVDHEVRNRHMTRIGFEYRDGRAQKAVSLNTGEGDADYYTSLWKPACSRVIYSRG